MTARVSPGRLGAIENLTRLNKAHDKDQVADHDQSHDAFKPLAAHDLANTHPAEMLQAEGRGSFV